MASFFTNTHGVRPEMPPSGPIPATPPPQPEPTATWTYPTRLCRICREDVVPTVTMYPPGLPPSFQRPLIEYKNEDEYGRLIKPCQCRGGMRYIHELCLLRSRTEGVRPGSLWKCHECGHQFNFQRLTLQRYLGSNAVSGALTVLAMLLIMFMLGFIADPIINLYVDPYDTLVGNENAWAEVELNDSSESISGWSLHFLKGLVSMGLVGFLKTALLNPFQWWNLRASGWTNIRSSGTSTTGRDRAVNVSWIAVIIGISSAFYFFYRWVQAIIGQTLKSIGNNIVDTQLRGDDEDLKPPSGWKYDVPPMADEPPPVVDPGVSTHSGSYAQAAGRNLFTFPFAAAQLRQKLLGSSDLHTSSASTTSSERPAVDSASEVRERLSAHHDGTPDTSASDADEGWSFAGI